MATLRKKQRIMLLVFGAVALSLSAFLVSTAMRDSIVFFFGPAELQARERAGETTPDRRLRLGGLVETGSLVRGAGETVRFSVTDGEGMVPVTYTGVLPDLFEEGQGVVAEGYLRDGVFRAEEILAKHDENYMPREVAEELKKTGHWQEGQTLTDGLPQPDKGY